MPASKPSICVVVPLLNEALYLRESMDSLLTQDYQRLEIIVYDAGSTDGTLEILRDYPVEVIVEKGLGQMAAINRGWQRTKADFVIWWAGDDVYRPGGLTMLSEALQEHQEAGFVYADADIINAQGKAILKSSPGEIQFRDLVVGFPFLSQAALIRRSALERSGMMNEAIQLAADWDLFLRLAQYYPMRYVPFTVAARRIHSESEDAKNPVAGADAMVDVITCFFSRPDLSDDQRALYRLGIASVHMASGWGYCQAGHRRIAWQMLFRASRTYMPSLWTTRASRRLLLHLLLPKNANLSKWTWLKRAINRIAPRL